MPENKALSVEFAAKPELKKYMKKVMPFVQMAKDKVEKHGIHAIDLTTEFDEADVINKNVDYITYTLDVSLIIRYKCRYHLISALINFYSVGGIEHPVH